MRALITKLTTTDMGGAKTYNASGGFSRYDYHQVGDTIYVDGLKGKVIAKRDSNGNDDFHAGLPSYSNTSDFYARTGSKSGGGNLEEAIWRAGNEIKKGDKPYLRPLREERIAAVEIVPEASIFGGWLGYSVVMYEFTDEVAAAIRQQLESERE